MVDKYNKKDFLFLLDFIKTNKFDFYFTENNIRVNIDNDDNLNKLLKVSKEIYVSKEGEDILGIILLWESKGADKSRFYIKIAAKDNNIAHKLLTMLLWNTTKDLYIKINKYSKFLEVFKNKGFRFIGNRGKEILMYHQYRRNTFTVPYDSIKE